MELAVVWGRGRRREAAEEKTKRRRRRQGRELVWVMAEG